MPCACKVNQQLSYLQKKYGTNPQSKKTNIRGNVGLRIRNVLALLLIIPLLPAFVVYILIKFTRGENIKIDNFLKKKKDV